MVVFETSSRKYQGATAVEVVEALIADASDYPHRGRPIRHFLDWSLRRLGDRVPPRDLDLGDRMDDESMSLNFLLLCDECGAGKVVAAAAEGI